VANDKGDGEDLFEDLDKFFAPIRDVDWDEPEEATERAPHESHVEVTRPPPPRRASRMTPGTTRRHSSRSTTSRASRSRMRPMRTTSS